MAADVVVGGHRLQVDLGGVVDFRHQPTNSRHRHDYGEICWVTRGSGRYDHGTAWFRLQPGDVFVADPNVDHEISSYATRDLELFFVAFTLSQWASDESDPVVAAFVEHHRVHAPAPALARFLPVLVQGEDPWRGRARTANLPLFALEAFAALAEPARNARASAATGETVLKRVYDWVEANPARHYTAEDLAEQLGISARSLQRRFAEAGVPRMQAELNRRRMRIAAHRLLMGFSVAEAGAFVGYLDPAHFARSFRNAFGVAPKAFQVRYRPGSGMRTTMRVD